MGTGHHWFDLATSNLVYSKLNINIYNCYKTTSHRTCIFQLVDQAVDYKLYYNKQALSGHVLDTPWEIISDIQADRRIRVSIVNDFYICLRGVDTSPFDMEDAQQEEAVSKKVIAK